MESQANQDPASLVRVEVEHVHVRGETEGLLDRELSTLYLYDVSLAKPFLVHLPEIERPQLRL